MEDIIIRIVWFNYLNCPPAYRHLYPFIPFYGYLLLSNTSEHCTVMDPLTRKVFSGYHAENFIGTDCQPLTHRGLSCQPSSTPETSR